MFCRECGFRGRRHPIYCMGSYPPLAHWIEDLANELGFRVIEADDGIVGNHIIVRTED